MKKFLLFTYVAVFCLSLCACGNTKTVKQTENLILEQLIVDDTYSDKDNSSRRALYAFFSLNPNANIKFDCQMDLMVDDINTYHSELLPSTLCTYAPNYYYSKYLEDAYVGDTQKFVVTFLVPEGDLTTGKQLKFSDSEIEEIGDIIVFTDDITHVNGDDEAAKLADPDGYAEIMNKFEDAPFDVQENVASLINGRYWQAYVNPTTYTVEFDAPNNFVVKTAFGSNGGTYSVKNGYIFCTYSSNNTTIKIPYEITEQGVYMDLAETFRIN